MQLLIYIYPVYTTHSRPNRASTVCKMLLQFQCKHYQNHELHEAKMMGLPCFGVPVWFRISISMEKIRW